MARRFIVKDNDILLNDEKSIRITGDEVKHIQVLRHNVNDEIIVNEYICKIIQMGRDFIELEKLTNAPSCGVPTVNLTLYIALLKNDKLDYIVQKAVELGVKTIVPFNCSNVIVKLDDKNKIKRREKLQKIALEACKQCGRTDEVLVKEFISFKQLLNSIIDKDINFFAYENENKKIHDTMNELAKKDISNISCIIGPEGGFTLEEANHLREIDNVETISLGTRILRAETAAVNTISIIMYEFDRDFN